MPLGSVSSRVVFLVFSLATSTSTKEFSPLVRVFVLFSQSPIETWCFMSAVLSSEITVRPDSYFLDESRKSIAAVLEDCERRGIEDPQEIRFLVRRACPFSNGERKGRSYKIFNREVLALEADLGLPVRKHRETEDDRDEEQAEGSPMKTKSGTSKRFELPSSREELLTRYPAPETYADAVTFIRKNTRTNIFIGEDVDILRVVLRQHDAADRAIKYQVSVELATDNAEDWENAYLDTARQAHSVWISNELSKF
jgi:hypothetical protein